MKKILLITGVILCAIINNSCTDWLQVYPQNNQVSDYLWTSGEDVEEVVNAGYYNLRNLVVNTLIPFGEFRGGSVYSKVSNNLQLFRVKPTAQAYSNWGPFYEIINTSNIVLANAEKALKIDETYDENMMNAHKAEAYFMRALCYFYLVRNWRDVPLVLKPYENDEFTFDIAKSTEAEVIAQIKSDLNTALTSGAAKEYYETTWETKGRATKWSMMALMADVCLWSEDYVNAEKYCNAILNSTSAYAPKFLQTQSRISWYSMFNPGNSNESIFELQWDKNKKQVNNLTNYFSPTKSDMYKYTPELASCFLDEYLETTKKGLEAVRTMYSGCFMNAYDGTTTEAWCWKYVGSEIETEERTSDSYDANFIIYRVAEILLIKAEALVYQGASRYKEAINIINDIRLRSNLNKSDLDPQSATELDLLKAILYERQMELAGEGKMWYDLLRMGRNSGRKYWDAILVNHVIQYKFNSSSDSWVRSVFVSGDDAMFLPVWENELKYNKLLKQNPYYE